MTKMSEAQQFVILESHNSTGTVAYWGRGYVHTPRRTRDALLRRGWIAEGERPGQDRVTVAGLIAAGIDMDAVAAQAALEAAMEGHWIRGLINV